MQAPNPKPSGKMTENPDNGKPVRLNAKGKPIGTTVRPGQRKPFRKNTRERQSQIVEFVANLLVKEKTRCEIHSAVKRRYDIEYLQCDMTYVKRAKQWLIERVAITAAQAKMKGLNVLVDTLKNGTIGERLKAERRLAEVFGYDAPRKMEVTGRDGQPLVPEARPLKTVTTEELVRMAYEDCRQPVLGGNGGGNGHGN